MVRCFNDALHFSYPAVLDELLTCATAYVDEWTPGLKSEDVPTALEDLLVTTFSHLEPGQQMAAREAVGAWSTERMRELFREVVFQAVSKKSPDLQARFQRTLRIPDDGRDYPLPAGVGLFPLRSITPVMHLLPDGMQHRGGVLMPMYQAEALWIDFTTSYPFAIKVGSGALNALTGFRFEHGLQREPQSYLVAPDQPWLDGFKTAPGVVRQFVCTMMGQGHTVEEQTLGTADGGIQLEVFPLKVSAFFEKVLKEELPKTCRDVVEAFLTDNFGRRIRTLRLRGNGIHAESSGLGAGGCIRQEIYYDRWDAEDWDLEHPRRVWVHIIPAAQWMRLTGELPPQSPLTSKEYAEQMLPWFDYYRDDLPALPPTGAMDKVESLFSLGAVSEVDAIDVNQVVPLGPHAPEDQIVEWDWS